jgi:hypothetical protein
MGLVPSGGAALILERTLRSVTVVRGALAGAAAAAAWAGVEPLGRRLLRPPPAYSDLRLLGRPFSATRWRLVGLALHLGNGAAFGAAFVALGGRGWKQGLAVAQAENVLLWPSMVVVDRFHPDRRSGAWPPLLRNGRVFAYEAAMHTVFGATLGLLVRPETGASASFGRDSSG